MFASDYASYVGQPVGCILADSQIEAEKLADLCEVHIHKDEKKPVISLENADTFFNHVHSDSHVIRSYLSN